MEKLNRCPKCQYTTFTVTTLEEIAQDYDAEADEWLPFGTDDRVPIGTLAVVCANCGEQLDPETATEWVFGKQGEEG